MAENEEELYPSNLPENSGDDEAGAPPDLIDSGASQPLSRDALRSWLDDEAGHEAWQATEERHRRNMGDVLTKRMGLIADARRRERANAVAGQVPEGLSQRQAMDQMILGDAQSIREALHKRYASSIRNNVLTPEESALQNATPAGPGGLVERDAHRQRYTSGRVNLRGDSGWQYADEKVLAGQFSRAMDTEFGQGKYEMHRIGDYRYRVQAGGNTRTGGSRAQHVVPTALTVVLDPVLEAPVISGKMLVPTMDEAGVTPDHMQTTAQALHNAGSLDKALEAGLNVPGFSALTGQHTGGLLSRAHVAVMKNLRQVGPKLKMYYNHDEPGPTYAFIQGFFA